MKKTNDKIERVMTERMLLHLVNLKLIKKADILMYNRLKANYKHILIPFISQIELMKNNQSEKDVISELNIQIAQVSERVMMINRLKDNNLADPSFYIPACSIKKMNTL